MFLMFGMMIGLMDVMLFVISPMSMILFGGWLDLMFIIAFWAIQEWFMTPKSAKTLRDAKAKKRIPLFIEHDNGLLEIKLEKESTPEGSILTKDGWRGFLPRASVSEDPNEAKALKDIAPLLTRKPFMPDVGMTAWVGYAGKGILTNIKTIAELEHAPSFEQGLLEVGKLGNDPDPKQTIAINKGEQVNVFWPVSLKTLKPNFTASWNIAAIKANETQAEAIGYKKAQRNQRNEKMIVWFLIAAGFCIGMFAVAMYFLK